MFKIVGTLTEGDAPFKLLPVTDAEAITRGEGLVVTSGKLTKVGATAVPQYIAVEDVAAGTGNVCHVIPVRETDELEVPATAQIAETALGGKVTIHTDGLQVTSTTTSGVFRLKRTDGLDPSTVVGVFEV